MRADTDAPPGNEVASAYRAETAAMMSTRMLYAMLGFLAIMAVAAIPELLNHPDRSFAYAALYAAEALIWLAATYAIRRQPRPLAVQMLVALATTVAMIALMSSYHIILRGEPEVVELAVCYVALSSMVLFPWGGRYQAVVAGAGVAGFLIALASGLELRSPVGLHVLGLATAASLSVVGAVFLERYRHSVFLQAAELRRVNEAKTQMLANVSHELRTPLSVVIGYQQLLQEGVFGELPAAAQDPLDRIMVYSRMLLTLVDDFLDLSRLEASRLNLRMESVELRDLCAEVGHLIEPLLRDKPVQYRCSINNGQRVYADRDRLRQILVNLLTNAAKFTDQGSIELRCRPATPEQLVIEVADTGIGIAPTEHKVIFEPFRRGTQADRVRGVGIGLALARQLTEAMGGRMSVNSTLGHGATFSVELGAQQHSAAS